jgi:UDP-N-acetylglucosamine diphosphorylase/glucosamine-1-phosphate N-acetyltransferase
MNYILFDDQTIKNNLLPLSFTRPIAEIRFGIRTMREKWEFALKSKTSTLTDEYLELKFPIIKGDENTLINSSICPSKDLLNEIKNLKSEQILVKGDKVIALRTSLVNLEADTEIENSIETKSDFFALNSVTDLFTYLDDAIKFDFEEITKGRKSQPISSSNQIAGKENIFIEEGAIVEMAMINATTGPIYIGKDAEVMEGAMLRGPVALGEHSAIKMGAKIYGASSFGPHVKVGGEVNNSLIFGYSNKAHDGFMGQTVIGEWCNIGADTNISNLKNTYETVKLWNYTAESFVNTGLQFCGLIMGDHSKTGINTMINTGSVIGVFANVFGSGYPRNFVSSFNWGGPAGFKKYNFGKALKVAAIVYERRGMEFTQIDADILEHIYNVTR